MKAIISNHKRSQVCEQEITYDSIRAYVAQEFPRMQEVEFMFRDLKGNEVAITSQDDIDLMKKMFNGQNFVEIKIKAKKIRGHGHGHGRKHGHSHKHRSMSRSHEKRRHSGLTKKEKRLVVLAKVYGGEPSQFEIFEKENE